MPDKKGSFVKIVSVVLVIIIGIFAAAAFTIYSYYNDAIYKPIAESGKPKNIEVVINKGSTSAQISDTLSDIGLIRNKTTFLVYLKMSKLDGKIKAGKYEFNTSMNVIDIVDKMVKGEIKKDTIKVTIPEGYEIKDIAAALEKAGLVNKDKFIEATQNGNYNYDFLRDLPKRQMKLEGYLFPDTYEFAKDVTADQIIRKMLDRFDEIFDSNMKKKTADMHLSIDQVITMASIVEREAKAAIERPLVSAVFYNRIKKNMRLESCATVQYALGERKEKLLYVDLEIKSPYNTYRNDGLPVGPIANPGKASIEAALNPANVEYLFFVAKSDGSGTHAFTVTYEDFLKEKQANK